MNTLDSTRSGEDRSSIVFFKREKGRRCEFKQRQNKLIKLIKLLDLRTFTKHAT